MKIIIVDEKDNVIGAKERSNLNYEKDIYRVSALWIKNSKDENLLAQRTFTKKHHPGKWGPAVAGTIEVGESYRSNIIKEAQEELGLKNIKPKKFIKEFIDRKYKHFTQWYILKLNKDLDFFKIDKNEVEQVKWLAMEEILKLIEEGNTVTLSQELLNELK